MYGNRKNDLALTAPLKFLHFTLAVIQVLFPGSHLLESLNGPGLTELPLEKNSSMTMC